MSNHSKEQSTIQSENQVNVGIAILLGHLVVNVPVLFIILSGLAFGFLLGFAIRAVLSGFSDNVFVVLVLICFLSGISLAWLWWSFSVPRWRRWALQHGAPAEQLHRWAVLTGLEWTKGHVFEKTEFKPKE